MLKLIKENVVVTLVISTIVTVTTSVFITRVATIGSVKGAFRRGNVVIAKADKEAVRVVLTDDNREYATEKYSDAKLVLGNKEILKIDRDRIADNNKNVQPVEHHGNQREVEQQQQQ